MVSGNGINVNRRLTVGSHAVGEELSGLRTNGAPPNFVRAVVLDVISDPLRLTEDDKNRIKTNVGNQELVDVVVRDSIIGRVITNGQDMGDQTPKIFFPFIPPHLRLPVKPGETVWVIFDDPSQTTTRGYWLWRVNEQSTVDDINFTHADRAFDPYNNPSNMTTSIRTAIARGNPPENINLVPSFPNGNEAQHQATLSPSSRNTNPYDDIYRQSLAITEVTLEPSPRFTKRPGDFVLMGSNNTRLVLGEDRSGPAKREDTSTDKRGQAGSIDIVVGVGRVMPVTSSVTPSEQGTSPTAPRVIQNTRTNKEVDKTPFKHNATDNLKEGDPDFQNDVSRIVISQKTDGDINFNLRPQFPTAFQGEISTVQEKGYIVLKSDQLRLLARKEQLGSIRIIKEGTSGHDGDFCSLLFLNDGTIQLDGKIIFIGRTGGSGPGANGSEPYIKYSIFEKRMQELIDEVEKLRNYVESLNTSVSAAFIASTAVPFSPIASLVAVANGLMNGTGPGILTAIKTKLESIRNTISEAKSLRIFGE